MCYVKHNIDGQYVGNRIPSIAKTVALANRLADQLDKNLYGTELLATLRRGAAPMIG